MIKHLFGILLTGVFLFSSTSFAEPTYSSASGYIPRDADMRHFLLNLEISGIDPKDIENNSIPSTLYKRLAIKITKYPDSGSYERIKYAEEPTSDLGFFEGYSAAIYNTPTQETSETGKISLSFILKISDSNTTTDTKSLSSIYNAPENDKKVAVELKWKDNENQTQSKTIDIVLKNEVANAAPSLNTPTPAHLGATVTWPVDETIEYSAGEAQAPAGTVIYFVDGGLVEDAEVSYELPATNYNTDIAAETPASCTLRIDGTSCSLCDTANIYLDYEAIHAETWADTIPRGADSSQATSFDLEKGHRYAVFGTYLPDGLQRSQCFVVVPTENMSLSELYGADEAKNEYPGCFIATAAYGTPFHKNLKTLRWFRNTYLLTNPVGKAFVRSYYRWSPSVAQFIGKSPILKAVTRGALWVPVLFITSLQQFPSLTAWTAAILGGIMMFWFINRFYRRTRP